MAVRFRVVVLGVILLFTNAGRLTAAPILDVAVSEDDGLFTYVYTLSGVDPGRKVTGISWVILEGAGAPQPEYLPLSWTVPLFWNFLPGHDGPVPGGVWMSNTGVNDGHRDFPIGPDWGILLSDQSRTFSFTTGYAPREGTYFVTENADGSEVNYQFLTGTTLLPNYNGTLVETPWLGQDTLNVPEDWAAVPEPSTLLLVAPSLVALRKRLNRSIR